MDRGQQINGNLALEQKQVIVIEAAQRPEAQKLRVAVYCRVSSDSSDQLNSFAAQLNLLYHAHQQQGQLDHDRYLCG